MAQIIKTTFQLRRGLEAAWKKNNPLLAPGEPSFVTDKNYLKIGNGESYWNDLKPIGLGESEIALLADDKSIVIANERISIKGFEEALPGAHPVKQEDGTLAWIIPDTSVEKVEEALIKLEKEVYKKEEVDNLLKEINVNSLVQNPNEVLILYGGSASNNI